MSTALNVADVRRQFAGLDSDEVLFDNAGGSQVLHCVIDRIGDWFRTSNVQIGASYARSRVADERLKQARLALAGFIGARSSSEVVIGPSSTQLLANLSFALARRLLPGDEIIVSDADHAANVTPWMALSSQGIVIRRWPLDATNGLLDPTMLDRLLGPRTRLVCFTHCSNVTGAIEPAAAHVKRIHDAGALAMVDGVAFAPHRQVNVDAIGADFYVLSLYKTFGPHLALLRIKEELFHWLPGINHPFVAEDDLPYKLQPGQANHELSWAAAAVPGYIASLGGGDVVAAWHAIAVHEAMLVTRLLSGLNCLPSLRIVGPLTAEVADRIALVSFVSARHSSREIVAATDSAGIGIRHGAFYSSRLVEAMGLSPHDGVVRVSMAHYNTFDEVDRLLAVLSTMGC